MVAANNTGLKPGANERLQETLLRPRSELRVPRRVFSLRTLVDTQLATRSTECSEMLVRILKHRDLAPQELQTEQ